MKILFGLKISGVSKPHFTYSLQIVIRNKENIIYILGKAVHLSSSSFLHNSLSWVFWMSVVIESMIRPDRVDVLPKEMNNCVLNVAIQGRGLCYI